MTTAASTPSAVPTECNKELDVFISYSWTHQNVVRLIYNGLRSENLSCWMDEKVMGVGDSLYRQIAGGLGTCKLVVACVSKQYTVSKNCNQEMKYAYDLNKAIIPVIIEELQWPLDDQLGFIFAGRLYIDVSKSLQELENWKGDKVDELVKSVKERLSGSGSLSSMKNLEISPYTSCESQGNCVELLIFYRATEFTPRTCTDVRRQQQYQWSSFPHIKCFIRGMTAGLTSFEVVRDAMNSVFVAHKGEVAEIGQRCGRVLGNQVAEATSQDKDEVEKSKELRQFCTVQGEQYSWCEAGKPGDRRRVKSGDKVIICGGQRRTVLVIRP